MINIDRVTKNYPTKQSVVKAVDNISLEIKEGEFFVITGPSGSGKTTLLMLIGCMLSPSQGSIIYDTLRIETLRQSAKAKFCADNIGFFFRCFI